MSAARRADAEFFFHPSRTRPGPSPRTRKQGGKPIKINTMLRMSGGKEDAGTKDAREELVKEIEKEEQRQGGGQ